MAGASIPVSSAEVFARPAADRIWLGPRQQDALQYLLSSRRVRLLVGPVSCGKSTVLDHFVARPTAERAVLHTSGAKADPASLLASLLTSANLAPWDLTAVDQRNLFGAFVEQRRAQGRRVIVAIDDAQACGNDVWEEILRIAAFTLGGAPAVELVLAGNLAVVESADRLATHLGVNSADTHVMPAAATDDLLAYVEWRLEYHDMTPLVSPIACQMIARVSGGRYAAVDLLCRTALSLRERLRLARVDAGVVRQAMMALAVRRNASTGAVATTEPAWEAPPQGHLVITRDERLLERVALADRMLIGRSEHNDVCLPSPYLSRHHAAILGTPHGYYVVDLNSANGLLVNGVSTQRARLDDGDIVTLGPFRIEVQFPEWLARGNPLLDAASAHVRPAPTRAPAKPAPAIRRVK